MFHFTHNVRDWPQAVALLPAHYAVKALDNVQMLSEAKATNSGIVRILRHHYTHQQAPGAGYEDSKRVARDFFRTFIDDTYRNGSTAGVRHNTTEYVEGWNEYGWHPGQDPAEGDNWAEWVRALLDVWYTEYWPELGANIIVSNIAVGNDCHHRVAESVARWTDVGAGRIPRIGYHSYWPAADGKLVSEDEWPWYSGRWTTIDAKFRAQGIYPLHWALTEAGAVGARGTWPKISLDPLGGWMSDYVMRGNWDQYYPTIHRFMTKWRAWNRANDYRCLSPNLFSSSGPGEWEGYQLEQPFLNYAAQLAQEFPTKPPTTTSNKPPDPIPERTVRTIQAANIRLSPYYDRVRGNWNRIGTLPAGAELELVGWQNGQTWQHNPQWAKVRLPAAYGNGTLDVVAFIHSLLVNSQ